MSETNTQGYASDVIVGSALPIEMDYRLPASLPASKNFEIRLQPINSQSFKAGNLIQIDVPCGRAAQFIDPTSTYLRFKATYTGGTVDTNTSRLMGSAYSYLLKQEVYGNNSVLLESINELGILANMMCNLQLNDADKRGLSSGMGFAFDTGAYSSSATAGHLINKTTDAAGVIDGQTFDYCIPIMGILGSGTSKMFPIGEIYSLRIEWVVDSFTNFTRAFSGTNVTDCVISDVEFVANVIELSPEANALIQAQNPEKIRIRSQTYRQTSNQLAGQASGTQDLLVGIRVSSLKSIFMSCSNSGTGQCAEGKYASINPNLGQGSCYIIGGQNYPQRSLSPSQRPGDAFFETQKAIGALSFSTFNGCISKVGYNVASTAVGQCQAYNATAANVLTRPNQFYLGIDVETVQRKENLLSGINVNSSPFFFRCQIDSQLANLSHTLNFFAYYDVILEIDRMQKNIVAKF